jgi:hypothetical protein
MPRHSWRTYLWQLRLVCLLQSVSLRKRLKMEDDISRATPVGRRKPATPFGSQEQDEVRIYAAAFSMGQDGPNFVAQ